MKNIYIRVYGIQNMYLDIFLFHCVIKLQFSSV